MKAQSEGILSQSCLWQFGNPNDSAQQHPPGSLPSWCPRRGCGEEVEDSVQKAGGTVLSPLVTGRSGPQLLSMDGWGDSRCWDGENQSQVSFWRVAVTVASEQSGAWQSNVTGLPPPHPCRRSRWPGCREGVGRSSRGRGLGEETEKAKGVCGWPGRCLTSKCAGNTNELHSFMASCLPNWGASQVLGWRSW